METKILASTTELILDPQAPVEAPETLVPLDPTPAPLVLQALAELEIATPVPRSKILDLHPHMPELELFSATPTKEMFVSLKELLSTTPDIKDLELFFKTLVIPKLVDL